MKTLRKIISNYKESSKDLAKILVLILLIFAMVGCGGKKKGAVPFWMLGLTGTEDGSSGGGTSSDNIGEDQNGVLLPPSSDSSGSAGDSVQELETSGPAEITGQIVPVIGGSPICTNPPENNIPEGCVSEAVGQQPVDLTKVTVKLIKNVDGQEVEVATTNPNADGTYSFIISDLENGNYRVLIGTGEGLNYAYEDFQFIHDPTSESGFTGVNVNDLKPERAYHQSGAAILSGNVQTPGFSGDVTVPPGPLSGVTVELKDSNGNVIATTTTDGNGNYSFCFSANPENCPEGSTATQGYLDNGDYSIAIDGDSASSNGQPFGDANVGTTFQFSGNDQDVPTNVNLGSSSLAWQSATSSSATISVPIRNAAVSDDSTVYTVKLKDSAGNVIATQTQTGSGTATINVDNLAGGVYFVEVTSPNGLAPATSAFNFIPHSTGGDKSVTVPPMTVAPRPSNVIGSITGPGGDPNPVPGAVVNFRPDESQPPSNLAYLALAPGDDANTVRLRNIANLWMREACTHIVACETACAATGYQASCVITNQGTGPWQYDTYSNKVYEVNGTQLHFTAVAGKWDYYISAPGYANSEVSTMTLNGQPEVVVPAITLEPSTKRSQIQGNVVVVDTLVGAASPTMSPNVSGLFAVMLGNTDNNGQPVAHVTMTQNGQFAYNGTSKVVSLANVPDLDGDGRITDTDRIKFAIGSYASAPLLSNATNVAGEGATNSVDTSGGKYNFKQSSYQVVIVDPLGHILTTPKQADNSSVANTDYATTDRILNLANIPVPHQSRRQISGTITDAIDTNAVQGAEITLGVMVNNQFQATVRRDCVAGTAGDSTSCPLPTTRTPGSDQLVPTVTTDANGQYKINNINPGEYVLKISKNGVDTYVQVSVPSSGPQTVTNVQVITTAGRGNLTGSVRMLNSSGNLVNFTGTYSLEILNPTFGTRPSSGIMPASLSSGPTSFTNVPDYNVFSINAGTWKVRFTATGYLSVDAIVNIQANATTNLDIITQIPGYTPPANITGQAINAMTNTSAGMSGLTVRIREGVNVTNGPYVANVGAVTTASDGSYVIPRVPAGNYTLEVSGPGVITTYRTVVSAGTSTPSSQNIVVSPTIPVDQVRIVVTWGEKPRDVDSHLEYGNSSCRTPSGKKCQVVWNDRCHLGSGTCNNGAGAGNPGYDAALDVDDVTSYGPETITLKGTFWNAPIVSRRGYSLYNWTNESPLSTSGTEVKVFKSTGMVRRYVISAAQTARWWQIFCLTANKSIIDAGQPGCSASDFFNLPSN